MCYGWERAPTTGTPHIHVAVVLGGQVAKSSLLKTVGFKRADLQQMKGTIEEAYLYCYKDQTNPDDFYEFGNVPAPGKRNDLHIVCEQICSGTALRDIARDPQFGAPVLAKYPRGLSLISSLNSPHRTQPPRVYWFHGDTGTGKTRGAYALGVLLGYSLTDIWSNSANLQWFDFYERHKFVIFDDFREDHVTFSFFLKLLDRYPLTVPFKGGHTVWNPEYIIVTSPFTPGYIFNNRRAEDIRQVERRITGTYEFPQCLPSADLHIADDSRYVPSELRDFASARRHGDISGDPDDEELIEFIANATGPTGNATEGEGEGDRFHIGSGIPTGEGEMLTEEDEVSFTEWRDKEASKLKTALLRGRDTRRTAASSYREDGLGRTELGGGRSGTTDNKFIDLTCDSGETADEASRKKYFSFSSSLSRDEEEENSGDILTPGGGLLLDSTEEQEEQAAEIISSMSWSNCMDEANEGLYDDEEVSPTPSPEPHGYSLGSQDTYSSISLGSEILSSESTDEDYPPRKKKKK